MTWTIVNVIVLLLAVAVLVSCVALLALHREEADARG